jgi:nitrate/nitrite-specific signal transduction histidine kinase
LAPVAGRSGAGGRRHRALALLQREQQRKQATSRHGALARELHDSVAQQLGYLSYQARWLQSQVGEPAQAFAAAGCAAA